VVNNVVALQLTSFEMPAVWHSISTVLNNNTFTIYTYNATGYTDASYNIVIPDGNYTQHTFATTLNNIFGIIGNALSFLLCEVDEITLGTVIRAKNALADNGVTIGPFPFSPTSPQYSPNFRFTVDFTLYINSPTYCSSGSGTFSTRPIYKNLGWQLGFRQTVYTVTPSNETISFVANPFEAVYFPCYLKSESFFGSTLNNYLFLEIDDFQNNFPTDTIISNNGAVGSYLGKNIIARIVVRKGINSMVNDNASDLIFKKRNYFGPVNLEKMKIRVLNKFGDVVDINQNDFSMTLELTTLNSNC
jgi:hypothetical protein